MVRREATTKPHVCVAHPTPGIPSVKQRASNAVLDPLSGELPVLPQLSDRAIFKKSALVDKIVPGHSQHTMSAGPPTAPELQEFAARMHQTQFLKCLMTDHDKALGQAEIDHVHVKEVHSAISKSVCFVLPLTSVHPGRQLDVCSSAYTFGAGTPAAAM